MRSLYNRRMPRPVGLVVLAALLGCAAARAPNRAPSPALGQRVDDLGAPDLAGREVRVGDAAGRVRVVDFWASWCEPCREQLPLLERLAREHGTGLMVYAISFDDERTPLDAFLARIPVSFPVLWDRAGDKLGERLAIRRLPTTWVIDRAGVVRAVHVGFDAAEGEKLVGEVRRLLAEPVPAAR
jgi:cytochrome c biogenesis protein CcmG/thiol:disulfide interchange protein DsbE